MANIVTVQLRCFRAPDLTRRVRTRQISRCVCPEGSYYVPLWSRDQLSECVFDFQYGSRWSNDYALNEGWTRLRSLFSSIWVRSYDQGADHERYVAHGERCPPSDEPAYGFDEVTLELKPDAITGLRALCDKLGTQLAPLCWRLNVGAGRYHARNPRLVWSGDPTLTTPSTSAPLTYLSALPSDLPQPLCAHLARCPEALERLDLMWRGRLVKRVICVQGELKQFPLDHWDNYLHPSYLETWSRHQRQWRLR